MSGDRASGQRDPGGVLFTGPLVQGCQRTDVFRCTYLRIRAGLETLHVYILTGWRRCIYGVYNARVGAVLVVEVSLPNGRVQEIQTW